MYYKYINQAKGKDKMFKNYIITLLEEKGFDLEDTFTVEASKHSAHIYTYEQFIDDLVELTKDNKTTQMKIKKTFAQLDFKNMDIQGYIDFLALGIVKSYQSTL